jgi:hypothetical protein
MFLAITGATLPHPECYNTLTLNFKGRDRGGICLREAIQVILAGFSRPRSGSLALARGVAQGALPDRSVSSRKAHLKLRVKAASLTL